MKTELRLAQVARQMRGAGGWNELLASVRAFADEAKDNVLQSPVDRLQILVGFAQGCAALLKVLETCENIADQAEKINARNHQRER